MFREEVSTAYRGIQDDICRGLEILDGEGRFREDSWERPGGGGGRTRIIQGALIEKGGVNFSAVHGDMPKNISDALGIGPTEFFATGVSIVLHPHNPHVPIIHMNIRYFETGAGLWWFGGGIDLTPHFVVPAQAAQFHAALKDVCDRHNDSFYPEFKKWADDYFYIKHREETRGVGGIFYDRLGESRGDRDALFNFSKDVGRTFFPVYRDAVSWGRAQPFTEREKEWQFIRRGRYAEFNLVWDRGTRFGLDTGGNIESILMSLPPQTKWTYRYDYNAKEKETLNFLKKDIDWLSYTTA